MRILVTGGSGYIGSRLIQALAARADVEEVIDVDLRPPPAAGPKTRFVERSVTEDLRDLFTDPARRVDVALHLAWVVDPIHDADAQRGVCIGGTKRLLEACDAGSVRHLLFVSSGTAYGAPPRDETPLAEDAPLDERHHFQYSAEKREAEGLFQEFAAAHPGTLLQIVRPCVVGGPHVSNFIFRAIDRPFTLRTLGLDPSVQLVHEDDCAAAISAIVASRLPGAFNVAADGMLRLSDIYRRVGARTVPLPLMALLAVAGLAWRMRWDPLFAAPPGFVYFASNPWVISNRRLREEVGFRFRFTTEQVLEQYIAARG